MTTQSGNPTLAFAQRQLGSPLQPPSGQTPDDERQDGCGYSVKDLAEFQFSKLASPENLYLAFKQLENDGGHGAGTDGFRPEHFSERELRPILSTLSESLVDETYRPYEVRICTVPKNSGGTRDLSLFRLMDRVVAKTLQICLRPFWSRRLNPHSTWQIFARLHWTIQRRRMFVLATDDIRKCFDYARFDDVMASHRCHIDHPRLLQLIETVIRGNDSLDRRIGLAQGSPVSPIAMEVLLHHALDLIMEDRSRDTPQFRYVDNIAYLCSSVSEGNRALAIAEEILQNTGFQLKGEEGEPQDLRDPEYNRTFLGLIPRWQNGRLTFAIPQSAFKALSIGLDFANEAPKPSDNALRRCIGWLTAIRPALTKKVEQEVVKRVVDMAKDAGFRNVTHRRMLIVTASARKSWRRDLEKFRNAH